jgi:glutaredoxin 3
MADVTLYSSALCGFCHRAKALLESKGVSYREISVDGDMQARQEMMDASGRHTVPQIWIGERHVGGCDDLYALERAGKLEPLLGL